VAKNMTVRLDDDQAEALEAVAVGDEVPMSEAIRQAIDGHIAARRKDKAFQARLRASLQRNKRILEKLSRR
jgi:predicted transcriptional regulator